MGSATRGVDDQIKWAIKIKVFSKLPDLWVNHTSGQGEQHK